MGAHPPIHPPPTDHTLPVWLPPRSDIPFRYAQPTHTPRTAHYPRHCPRGTRRSLFSGWSLLDATSIMATSSHPPTVRCQYSGCHDRGPEWEFTDGQYCCTEHAIRDAGDDVLSTLAHDHRFCSSCYRPVRVVYRPADSECPKLRTKALVVRESFVGYEELTEHAEQGAYGVECTCGSVGYGDPESLCRDGSPYEWFLKRAVGQLRREGAWDHRFDVATFADAMWDGDDIDLAVGKAIR